MEEVLSYTIDIEVAIDCLFLFQIFMSLTTAINLDPDIETDFL